MAAMRERGAANLLKTEWRGSWPGASDRCCPPPGWGPRSWWTCATRWDERQGLRRPEEHRSGRGEPSGSASIRRVSSAEGVEVAANPVGYAEHGGEEKVHGYINERAGSGSGYTDTARRPRASTAATRRPSARVVRPRRAWLRRPPLASTPTLAARVPSIRARRWQGCRSRRRRLEQVTRPPPACTQRLLRASHREVPPTARLPRPTSRPVLCRAARPQARRRRRQVVRLRVPTALCRRWTSRWQRHASSEQPWNSGDSDAWLGWASGDEHLAVGGTTAPAPAAARLEHRQSVSGR